MNEAKKLIAKMIESGEYFSDAREWYASKYLYPYTQKAYIGVIAIVLIIFTIIIFQTTLLDNIKKKYPFPLYTEDEVNYYSKILPIADGSEPIPISVARYFASSYVKVREGYDFGVIDDKDNWKRLLREVRELSSRKVFSDYVDYVDTYRNPDSPVIRYKSNTKRIIEIEKVEFPRISNSPESAKVYYKAIEKTDKDEKTSFWVANLTFSMTDIDNVLDNKVKLQFTITKYDTYEIIQKN